MAKPNGAKSTYIPDELWERLDAIGEDLEKQGIADVRDTIHRGKFISRSKVLCRLIELHTPAKPTKPSQKV